MLHNEIYHGYLGAQSGWGWTYKTCVGWGWVSLYDLRLDHFYLI
jgi:hypothetical protein